MIFSPNIENKLEENVARKPKTIEKWKESTL